MSREDLTNWLIHFTKAIDAKDIVDVFYKGEFKEEDFKEENFAEDDISGDQLELDFTNQLPGGISRFSAYEALKNIIEECGIRYNFSFRDKITTLYGGEPVVCFTEMPIHSLIEYAKTRNEKSNSTYGIAIRKKDAYRYGARPVLYGLSESNTFEYLEKSNTRRILKENVLPLAEQFRLVPLMLDKNIDWTHEREWRIKRRNDIHHHTYIKNDVYLEEIEHLNIFEDGGHCEQIIVIVNSEQEANEMFDIILTLKDGSGNEFDTSFNPKSIAILVLQNLEKEEKVIRRIEDISNKSYFKVELEGLSQEELDWLKRLISRCQNQISKDATEEYLQKHKLDPRYNDFKDSAGFSSIVTYEVRNKYLRGLINLGIAFPIGYGYSIRAVGTHFRSQSISFHEYVTKKVCDELNREIGNIFYVHSNLD
ncbi:hypothetical protein [Lacihabitans lacunae]